MKMRKLLFGLIGVIIFSNLMALDHGSLIVKNAPLYSQRDGSPAGTPIAGQTVNFKIVTIGNKTWAWTELSGTTIMGEAWSSQLRWWAPGKTENNLTGRIAGTQQTYGQTTIVPATNPCIVTIFQHIPGEWVFRETDDFNYNYTQQNNADSQDKTAPVLADPVIVSQTASSLNLSLSATEVSGDYFYYITDQTNNYERVLFLNSASIPLEIETDYSFMIRAIDFSGNISEPKTINVKGTTFTCNNLLVSKTLTKDNPYFAPGWTASPDYTFDINTNNEVSISLTPATYEAWQGQFPVLVNPALTLTSGETYSLVMDVQTSKNLPLYAKFFDGNDNVFMEIPRQTVASPGKNLNAYDIICPAALTQISKILFDFGGNAAETQITISNISVCGAGEINSRNDIETGEISIIQSENSIFINSSCELNKVKLYNASGQQMLITLHNKKVDISSFEKGIYILKVEDINSNKDSFKIMIK